MPELGVVVLSYQNDRTILAAIDSLLTQDEPLEIVVSHSGAGEAPALLARHAPAVRVIAAAERRLPGAARNAGVAAIEAPFVGFLAGDCRALPGWASGRLARHRAGAPAVAGAMVPLVRSRAALASYVLQHSSRMPHLDMPPAKYRYGLSYARPVLERYGPFPEELRLGEDSILKERLIAGAVEIAWAPDVRTTHPYPTAVGALIADQYRRGRLRVTLCRSLSDRGKLVAQVLGEAAQGLARALRRGSCIDRRGVMEIAPLVFLGALASAAGVVRGGAAR
jgi:glycosyltransferase involved in cell wall biosynthesis